MSSANPIAVAPGMTGRRSAQLATLVVFVAFLDFFVGLPLVPTYSEQLGASPTWVGLTVGAYSATNLVGNVVAGYFLDRFGRRLPITMGLALTALALAGYALATNWETLLAVRGLHGVTAAVLTPGAFAMLGDSTQQGGRARMMGRSAAGIAVAAVVGPLSAGILADRIGYEPVFLIAAGLMAVTAVIYVVGSRNPVGAASSSGEQTPIAKPAHETVKMGGLAIATVVALALTIGIGTLATYMPLHVQELGETSRTSGAAFTVYALTALIMMVGAVGVIGDRYGRLVLVSAGLVFFGAGLFLMAWAPQGLWAVYTGMAIIGIGFGLLFPSAAALVADSGGEGRRGLAFGIFYGAYSLGVVIGAGMSGRIADGATGATGVPYAVAGVAVAICIVLVVAAIPRGIGAMSRDSGAV